MSLAVIWSMITWASLAATNPCRAQDTADARARWYAQTSVYTRHFSPDPEHNNQQNLVYLLRLASNRWLAGGAWFENSFGQESFYAYAGRLWYVPITDTQRFHFKLTAGLLYGYKDPYKDKIPFNDLGVAPAILPSIGYSNRRFGTELILFGAAGAMITAGIYFP